MNRYAISGIVAALLLSACSSTKKDKGSPRPYELTSFSRNVTTVRLNEPKPQPAGAETGEHWAFLVGIDDYASLPDLRYCANDMFGLREALVAKAGYSEERVELITDSDKVNSPYPSVSTILTRLESFLANPEIGESDTVLVAFAGHGMAHQGKSYLMAADSSKATKHLDRFAIPVSAVHDALVACEARKRILILDACHSAGRSASRSGSDELRVQNEDILGAEGIVQLLSCDVDQLSYEDPELEHGVFSHYVIEGLLGRADLEAEGNRDEVVTASELSAFVGKHVEAHVRRAFQTDQTPVLDRRTSGRFALARRDTEVLSSALTLRRLQNLVFAGHVSEGLFQQAEEWLALKPASAPVQRVHLLFEKLADRVFTEKEFLSLASPELEDVEVERRLFRVELVDVAMTVAADGGSTPAVFGEITCSPVGGIRTDVAPFGNVFFDRDVDLALAIDEAESVEALDPDSLAGRYQIYAFVPGPDGEYDLDGLGVEVAAELFDVDLMTGDDRIGGASRVIEFGALTEAETFVELVLSDAEEEDPDDAEANGVVTVTFRVTELSSGDAD